MAESHGAPTFSLLRPLSASRLEPKFLTATASESFLAGMRPQGAPERALWHPDRLEENSPPMFRLRAVELPRKPPKADKHGLMPIRPVDPEARVRQELEELGFIGGRCVGPPPEQPKKEKKEKKEKAPPKSRAEKYFNLLMKAHDQREKDYKSRLVGKQETKKNLAAERAHKAILDAEALAKGETRPPSSSISSESSDSDDSEFGEKRKRQAKDDDSDLEGPLELQPWDGVMKVNIEVSILRAPGEEEEDEGTRRDSAGTSRDGSKSSGSQDDSDVEEGDVDEVLDIQAELDALKEFEDPEDAESDVPDDVVVKRDRNYRNIWDAPDPRWALGLGGTVFFLPEVERYSLGPSLPPPPPPSILGRRRIRLKPRLPLDISHGRYRDERPNIWPEGVPTATAKERLRLEKKLMTLEFYQGCSESLSSLPQALQVAESKGAEREKLMHAAGDTFGKKVWDHTLKSGAAWSVDRQREQIKNKRKDDRRKQAEWAKQKAEMRRRNDKGAKAAESEPTEPAQEELAAWT